LGAKLTARTHVDSSGETWYSVTIEYKDEL